MYRPYCVADRPNHIRILNRAAQETQNFGVLVRETVTDTVKELVADLDVPVMVDNGAFAEPETEDDLVTLFDSYEQMGADYGLTPDVIGGREKNNDAFAVASRLFERGSWQFTPVGVAQGKTAVEYANSLWDLYQMGADHIAIGGLLQRDGDRSGGHATVNEQLYSMLDIVQRREPHIWEDVWIFVLGCDHDRRRPRFRELGVDASDSKAWLYDYDSDIPHSREEQLVDVVVENARDRSQTLSAFSTDFPSPS
jgi:hypothetical protein